MGDQTNAMLWERAVGSFIAPTVQLPKTGNMPLSYLLDLYLPLLQQEQVVQTVTEVIKAYVVRYDAVEGPAKYRVLRGARMYRSLPRDAVTGYNRTTLLRELEAGQPHVSRLYLVDLLALGLGVINFVLFQAWSNAKDEAYALLVGDWLRVCDLVGRFPAEDVLVRQMLMLDEEKDENLSSTGGDGLSLQP